MSMTISREGVAGIVTTPRVHLVGRSEVDPAGLAAFLAEEGVAQWSTDTEVGGERLVETAGRTCYMSFARPRPGGNKAYVDHLVDVGHTSVLEHAVFSLIVAGVSRSFTHELVRHRAGFSYSQLSQRYVDESECEFVVPPALEAEVAEAQKFIAKGGYKTALAAMEANRGMLEPLAIGLGWLTWMERSRVEYARLSDYLLREGRYRDYQAWRATVPAIAITIQERMDHHEWVKALSAEANTAYRKKAREAARSVLPNATETKIFVTANARAFRHFFTLRGSPAADAEMRRVAVAVHRALLAAAPNLFGGFDVVASPDGGAFLQAQSAKE